MGNTIADGLRFAAARGTASADNADYLAPVSIRECEVAATEIDNLTADRDRLRAEVESMRAEAQAASKLPWREAIQDQKFEDGDMILVAVPLHEDSGGGYDYAALLVHCDEHYFELKCDDEAWGWTWDDVEFWCPLNRPTARAANAQAGGEAEPLIEVVTDPAELAEVMGTPAFKKAVEHIAASSPSAESAVVEALREAVKLCHCRGKGVYTRDCTLCGDSTYDHYCNDKEVDCKDPKCVNARSALAAYDDARGGRGT